MSWLRILSLSGVAVLVLLIVCSAGVPAVRAAEPAVVLAVVDIQLIMRESTAVRVLSKSIEERRDLYQAELSKTEKTLRDADQELARQRSIISAEAFTKKRRDLEKKVAALQRQVQERKRGLDRIFSRGMAQVQSELALIAKEIAEERGLDLIVSKAAVVIVKPKLDITAEALKRLNERLPKIAAPTPEK